MNTRSGGHDGDAGAAAGRGHRVAVEFQQRAGGGGRPIPRCSNRFCLNLSVNSRDAMPKGGRLAIRISLRDVDTAHIRKSLEASPGKFVCLSHTDTGGGIPPENIQAHL